MSPIIFKKKGEKVIAIMLIGEWFKSWYEEGKMPLIIPKDYYVVCEYVEYVNTPPERPIEGGSTIAICVTLEDAELVFNNKKIA